MVFRSSQHRRDLASTRREHADDNVIHVARDAARPGNTDEQELLQLAERAASLGAD